MSDRFQSTQRTYFLVKIWRTNNFERATSSIFQIQQRKTSNAVQMNGMVPMIKEETIEGEKKFREIKIEYVAPDEAPRSEEDSFSVKEYPHDYFDAPILNWERQQMGQIKLPEAIFGEALRSDIIYRCLRHRVLKRKSQDGIRPTKNVSTISGSGRKPRPQKGSGRARMGKVRSNITVQGEKAHGRYARDISIGKQKKTFLMLQ